VEVKYTDEAREAKISGTVLLSVVVGTDGAAHQINVVSTPDAGLSTKAVEAVQQWTFVPGTLNGESVPVKAQIEVNFKLL
jgi:TonB family protein